MPSLTYVIPQIEGRVSGSLNASLHGVDAHMVRKIAPQTFDDRLRHKRTVLFASCSIKGEVTGN